MINIENLFFFIFIFSTLILLRSSGKFMSTLLQKEPKPLYLSDRELILLGTSISYIITYIFKQ